MVKERSGGGGGIGRYIDEGVARGAYDDASSAHAIQRATRRLESEARGILSPVH